MQLLCFHYPLKHLEFCACHNIAYPTCLELVMTTFDCSPVRVLRSISLTYPILYSGEYAPYLLSWNTLYYIHIQSHTYPIFHFFINIPPTLILYKHTPYFTCHINIPHILTSPILLHLSTMMTSSPALAATAQLHEAPPHRL